MAHSFDIRVYYEDTDTGGVVYYANYLKFAERARTEMLRAAGVNQSVLAAEQDVLFVVRRVELDLRAPSRLDDEICVETVVTELRGASIVMRQTMRCNDALLAEVAVVVVCVNGQLKPQKLPGAIRQKLEIF